MRDTACSVEQARGIAAEVGIAAEGRDAAPSVGQAEVRSPVSGRLARLRGVGWLRSIRTKLLLAVPLISLTPLIIVGSPNTSLVVMPMAMLLAWYLGWRAVRPVRLLRDRLVAAEAHPQPPSLRLGRNDELDELAAALEHLLEQRRRDADRYQQFVADLAHELKSPLAAMQTCSHALQAPGLDTARSGRISRVMRDSCARMSETLERLLEIARAERAPLAEASEIDVSELARGISDSFAADERYRAIAFEVQAPEPAIVLGAAYGIESALRNLIDNAASYAAPRGRVQVSVARSGERVHICVRDSGPGVPSADRARVFDRFFTTRGRGTGLGLALVKAVAEAHDGRAWVDDEPGWGAAFHMRFTSARHEVRARPAG